MVKVMELRIIEAVIKDKNTLWYDFISQKWLGNSPLSVSSKGLKHAAA